MKLSELAKQLDMEVVQVLRDCEVDSAELCTDVKGPHAVTYLEKEKFLSVLKGGAIAAVICPETLAEKIPPHIQGILVTDSPKFAFYCLHNLLAERRQFKQVPTQIGAGADIAPTAYIAPYDVKIGKNVKIEPGAVIHPYVTIGDDVRIGAGTIVGSSSFSPVRYRDQAITLLDCGTVEIGNYVEIRSLCSIERGVFENDVTVLADGVKIDQLVLIGHGVHVGNRSFIVGNAYIAGNCVIGEDVWIGGNSTISNRIQIGDCARVSLGSVVTKNVPAGQTVSGNFAIEHRRFLKNLKESIS